MNIVAVGVGGFFGAMFRYMIGEWFHPANGFPLDTLIINLLGCLFIGWFFNVETRQLKIHPRIKLAIGTGLVGAFTTFSAFSVETLYLIKSNNLLFALLYVLLSVFGGIGLVFIGAKLAVKRYHLKGDGD